MSDTALRSILIVDDEADVRDILRSFTADLGLAVREASNGEEALQVLRREPVHAVLSDLSMPKMSGITLLENVRAYFSDIPVVIITAFHDNDTIRQGLRLGAFDFISKPFQQGEVVDVVARAVETGVRLSKLASFTESNVSPEQQAQIVQHKKMIGLLSVKNNGGRSKRKF